MPLTVNQNSCFISLLSAFCLSLSPTLTPSPPPLFDVYWEKYQQVCSIAWEYWMQCENMERPHAAGVEAEAWCLAWRNDEEQRPAHKLCIPNALGLCGSNSTDTLSSPKHIYRLAQAETLAPVNVPHQVKSPWAPHAIKAEKQEEEEQCKIIYKIRRFSRHKEIVSPKHQQCLQLYSPAETCQPHKRV